VKKIGLVNPFMESILGSVQHYTKPTPGEITKND